MNINVYKTDGELAQYIADDKVDMVFNAEKTLGETDLIIQNIEMPRVTSIYLNPNKNKSFGDKDVRRAIYEMINRDEVVNKILKNAATPTFDILPGSHIKTDYTFLTDEELTKALEPIASTTVHLAITTSERQQRLAAYLKDVFFKYNINLEVQTFEANTLLQNEIKNRDFEMLLFTTEIESSYDLYAFLHSSQRNSPGLNITGYTSKTLDAEIDSIKSATNTFAIYDSILNIRDEFYKEYFYIPIYTPYSLMYVREGLNINLPVKIQTYKNIFADTENFYNETENVWSITITEQSKKIIRIIYKILH
jgi:ABC-type transport system substrate-binding protein